MAVGGSRNKALEWQPCFLRPKELRLGRESPFATGRSHTATAQGDFSALTAKWLMRSKVEKKLRVFCANRETLRLHVHKIVMNSC